MTSSKQPVTSGVVAKDPYHRYKRRVQKDTLLAEHPPAVLGIGLVVIAIVLASSVGALRLVEYQETVPISLTLRTEDGAHLVYGEAYMRPQEMTRVQPGQVVQIDGGGQFGLPAVHAEAQIRAITVVSENALYAVRVDLPPELAAGLRSSTTAPEGVQLQGKILTQKENLLDKLFGFFRMIAQSI
jgi:hypothetical protein